MIKLFIPKKFEKFDSLKDIKNKTSELVKKDDELEKQINQTSKEVEELLNK